MWEHKMSKENKKPFCSCGGTGCSLCNTSNGDIAGCYIATAVYGSYDHSFPALTRYETELVRFYYVCYN
jgi:hypothetical protein